MIPSDAHVIIGTTAQFKCSFVYQNESPFLTWKCNNILVTRTSENGSCITMHDQRFNGTIRQVSSTLNVTVTDLRRNGTEVECVAVTLDQTHTVQGMHTSMPAVLYVQGIFYTIIIS